jgi:hypothetical protein
MFVPDAVHSVVLEWANSFRLACHLGSHRNLAFVQQCFWWPTMVPEVFRFVAACMVCAQNSLSLTPCQAPAGLLQPLPVSHLPGLCHRSFHI